MSKRRGLGISVLALASLALSPPASGDDVASAETLLIPTSELAATTTEVSAPELGATSDYDIAVPTPLPPAVTVTSFINRSGVTGLDWLSPAVGFIAGELVGGNSKVRTSFDPLIVDGGEIPASPVDIAAFADKRGAKYVVTGSYARPDWELELRVELWEVGRGTATRKGLVVNRGEFKMIHTFMGRSLRTLMARANLAVEGDDVARVERVPTEDFYAFTLFGRGLSAMLRSKNARDWRTAKKNLERAVYIDPEFIEGQRVLGHFYQRAKESRYGYLVSRKKKALPNMAKVRFGRALEARPEYAAAKIAMARVAEESDQPEKARDLLAQVVRSRPFDFEARFRLGKVLWDVGQAEDSYAVLGELVKHHPNDVRARRILVMIHSARGSGEALVSELEAVAELDPSDEQTRMDLGAAYASVDRNRDAIGVYQQVTQRNPRNVAALKFLGDLSKKIGERERAVTYYGLALSAAPWDPRPYFNLGALYVEGGQDAKARRIYQRAMRFRRYHPEIHTNLGGIAFRAGRFEEALEHHDKAVTAEPRRARFRYNKALALSANGQLDEADEEITIGLKYAGNHVALNYLKGVVLLRRGKVEEASIQFEKTLELEPEHEDAMHNLQLIEELRRRAEEGEIVRERRL